MGNYFDQVRAAREFAKIPSDSEALPEAQKTWSLSLSLALSLSLPLSLSLSLSFSLSLARSHNILYITLIQVETTQFNDSF
jgi:hypothetical protein